MEPLGILFFLGSLSGAALAGFFFWQNIRIKKLLKTKTQEDERRLYELAVVKEVSDRIGYSLDTAKIIEIITGSLGQLFPYSTVASLYKQKEKIVFKCHLAESVGREFIKTVKEKMCSSLAALTGDIINQQEIDEGLTGLLVNENSDLIAQSFFNVPLVINEKVAGLINVASVQAGLYKEEEMTALYRITGHASEAVAKLENLLESEKGKITALLYSLSDGVIMTDRNNLLYVINPAAKRMLGLSVAPTLYEIFKATASIIDLEKTLRQPAEENRALVGKEFLLRDQWLSLEVLPVKNIKDELLGTVVSLRDISTQKELEKIREEFTSMMVHELRAPLGIIRNTMAYLKERDKALKEKQKTVLLESAEQSAENLLKLVNDLLDNAKISAGKFQISKVSQDLKVVVEKVVQDFAGIAKEKNIKIETKLEKAILSIDAGRIEQVMTNLISNAIKFSKDGGTILIKSQANSKQQREILVTVEDEGIGIPKEKIGELFSKFQQVNLPKRSGEGTGLGLAICKGIVEAHGGKIWIESEEGKGTTVSFTLPNDEV